MAARAHSLITIFDAIFPVRKSGQKLQSLYGNPMANRYAFTVGFFDFAQHMNRNFAVADFIG